MPRSPLKFAMLVVVVLLCLYGSLPADEKPASLAETQAKTPAKEPDVHAREAGHQGPDCYAIDRFFGEVWVKVAEVTCLNCHRPGGDAGESAFLLEDLTRRPDQRRELLYKNQTTFARLAKLSDGGKPRLLAKATGGLEHGGGEVLNSDSTAYRILERFVKRANGMVDPLEVTGSESDGRSFFEGVELLPADRLLRRVSLSLVGRLPTAEELAMAQADGMPALDKLLDAMLREEAFYDRLTEGFNDIFLTRGYDDVPESVLSYSHFRKTRFWPNDHDFSDLPEKDRKNAYYALNRVYRESMLREPMELIAYIVRNDHPFSEIATADYIMVSPYTARGYGIFEEIKDQFQDPENPYEYIPAKLKALSNEGRDKQESATGFYPHSGLLTTFHYTRRYPTTDTNRNRLRSRMYYLHFLGIDVMQLAPRVTDAAAVDAKYEIPTMQAAECVVCHRTVDPVAGLYQDYNKDGHFGPRREGWYVDMFGPGFEGADLPREEKWRALQWLGQQTVADPRFAKAMVQHVYYILTGRKVLDPPQNIDDPMFAAQRRAYLAQQAMIEEVAQQFAASNFDLKVALKAMIQSDFYRVDGLATTELDPEREAELDDIGLVRLLTPEQLERMITAIFDHKWNKLKPGDARLDILYGGIDSKEITERITDPSGAMGAIQRIMANEIACQTVPLDFSKKPGERILFPHIEIDVVPEAGDAAEQKIRAAIVHLHQRILGHQHQVDDPEVDRTYELFAGILAEAAEEKVGNLESYFCRAEGEKRVDDPHYTVRAWRAVVTYLLRQYDFLYE